MAKTSVPPVALNSVSQIGAGTEIKGDIQCDGDLRIDGSVVGTIDVKGKVVIGNAGVIEGEVTCKNGDVSGKIRGKITVQELLSLKSSSEFRGDIITKKLSIEPGSQFNGTCQMGDAKVNAPSSFSVEEK